MNYVRSISGAVSTTWNSINPATLSGAIDVVVVEQEDGSLACSPFHIRFGKFSLLRPSEKKVEFKVNGEKQEFPMKLGEGGEAFFVFETKGEVPEALQTSPLVSPATSPELPPSQTETLPTLHEPDSFVLEDQDETTSEPSSPTKRHLKSPSESIPMSQNARRAQSDNGQTTQLTRSPTEGDLPRPQTAECSTLGPHGVPHIQRTTTDSAIPAAKVALTEAFGSSEPFPAAPQTPPSTSHELGDRPPSPAAITEDAKSRAMALSKKLWTSNISNQVTESGDLMLDMTGFKSQDGEALHAEVIARQLLSEEMDGPYDIGALIGADEKGNIWIYSSEEAKEAAGRKASEGLGSFNPAAYSSDALSDPGYHSDDARSDSHVDYSNSHNRRDSDSALGMESQPDSPVPATGTHGDPNKNYAKTLRLTSDQLKTMNLQPGANTMAFTVNRATCTAILWYWRYDVPIVISDIDGTITKSDVLGHVMTSIGRDWTHAGVAKLYTEIAANGYNLLYLTSRSVGQADMTRAYLDGVVQEGYRLPKGPVILSPDRLIAALRREIYLRKPELFKMACLRDIMSLFAGHGGSNNTHESAEAGLHAHIPAMNGGRGKSGSPFYAGFGNRLTDALSYRSVNIPSTRIFTINSNSEISLDLLSLNKFKTAYSSMREIVDHYFPPVGLLVKGGGEEFTDFNYWRETPLDLADFTDSESESEGIEVAGRNPLTRTQTEGTVLESVMSEDEAGDDMLDSYISDQRFSLDESIPESADEEELEEMMGSMTVEDVNEEGEEDEYADGDDEHELSDGEAEEELSTPAVVKVPLTPDMSSDRRTPTDNDATPHGAGATARANYSPGLGISRATTPTDSELSSGPD